jgi:putative tryptophan/tyrosine transport system substrate-binding protein
MFQAKAGSGNTASARSTRDAISDTIASYAISDEEGARKKGSGQPLMNRSKQARMARKTIVALLVGLTLASVRLVEAQQPKKVPRIGLLRAGSPPDSYVEAFRQGLRELGYIEGQNIAVEYRWAEGKPERIPDLTAELVRLKVDVIVTTGVPGGLAAKQATSTIPIVVPAINDPIGSGLVASLARPGGNVTGLSMVNPELSEKRMELLKEASPSVSRVAVLHDPAAIGVELHPTEAAAQALGLRLQVLEVREVNDLETALAAAKKGRAGALNFLTSPFFSAHRARIVEAVAKVRLPTMYPQREFVDAGGLIAYGPSLADMFRRAATYVDKILKGTKPGDIPVEQPTKFELVINLKAAKQIGLTIPPNVLVRADKVIK